jgi:hypothetical protein
MPESKNRSDNAPKKTFRLQPSSSSMGTRNVLSANWALPNTNDALTAPPVAMNQP